LRPREQKVRKSSSNKQAQSSGTYLQSQTQIGGSQSKAGPRQKHKTLFRKITKAERARGMSQVEKCLPSKHEAVFKSQNHQN
jgi:hypothetical protein